MCPSQRDVRLIESQIKGVGSKERQGPTLSVRFTEVSVKREQTVFLLLPKRAIFRLATVIFSERVLGGDGGNTSSVRARTVSAKILLSESVLLTTISPSLQGQQRLLGYLSCFTLPGEREKDYLCSQAMLTLMIPDSICATTKIRTSICSHTKMAASCSAISVTE